MPTSCSSPRRSLVSSCPRVLVLLVSLVSLVSSHPCNTGGRFHAPSRACVACVTQLSSALDRFSSSQRAGTKSGFEEHQERIDTFVRAPTPPACHARCQQGDEYATSSLAGFPWCENSC